jgi:hypothetical protein
MSLQLETREPERPRDADGVTILREVANEGGPRSGYLTRHRTGIVLVGSLCLISAAVHLIGMQRFPARVDDEGTYVAQAWAISHLSRLTHYTYWYDHPPLGWIQISAYAWLTDAFNRWRTAVAAGREAMLVCKLASVVLIYALARRLGMRRSCAALAIVLFALSPLAVQFQRMVFLDNVATPWLIAAFVCAACCRDRLAAAAGSAACFAVAVLSKETTLVLLPGLVWQMWQSADPRNRKFSLAVFGSLFGSLVLFYPLYAALKGEFLQGPGHVSLLWAAHWQVMSRPPTGSLLDLHSKSWGVVHVWTGLDPWVLLLGVLAIPVGFAVKRLRPVTLALAVQVAMTLRNGYLPFPYVIAVLPFAAVVTAGAVDAVLGRRCKPIFVDATYWRPHVGIRGRFFGGRNRPGVPRLRTARRAAVVVTSLLLLTTMVPAWASRLHEEMTLDQDAPLRLAGAWVTHHVPRGAVVVVDDSLWVDLKRRGYDVIWFFKLDLDPAVRARYGWNDVDYLVLVDPPKPEAESGAQLRAALEHSSVAAAFGSGPQSVTIFRVNHAPRPVR